MNDNLVPEPESSVFDSVTKVMGDELAARKVMANPQFAAMTNTGNAGDEQSLDSSSDPDAGSSLSGVAEGGIPLKAVDDIGRATAADVKEALHQVIDPELGVDVIDLGLVYGIEIDSLSRAIITMTLTTPACPLTDLIEDECASTLAGLVEEFRIDWTWQPRWSTEMITPDGRDQLAALGFNFDNLPTY
ncbi:metal-sulfur cluster assembly factor [Bifidobacterium tsurumiense]|uniref:FeS assembly SUF system domain n=1 Tax=Bifidobacterium tsurumiense TaxID=356829 RepID=A0A087EDV9_9BIFI|nr:metal-sulfur cluster assembly factor [Bifidobacterium tsurumiense]KFJ05960.1 FeS assembly SUF system domain [Bifidobacterium tsurumiense]MDY4678024.1 metal-sulfur cluster assembly factor [Bifidobacterium tsurumiense]MSS12741.1 metal-sulfur cluster assembly factor [Bifidobacterium tsurumiense]